MAIAIPRRKSIKVGDRRSALIELPHAQSYEIGAKWDHTPWDESLLKRGITELSVKGFADIGGLNGISSLPLENFATSSQSDSLFTFYELSGRFRHCEETADGYEFFNEDDTL
jgi:hypothetical protein